MVLVGSFVGIFFKALKWCTLKPIAYCSIYILNFIISVEENPLSLNDAMEIAASFAFDVKRVVNYHIISVKIFVDYGDARDLIEDVIIGLMIGRTVFGICDILYKH